MPGKLLLSLLFVCVLSSSLSGCTPPTYFKLPPVVDSEQVVGVKGWRIVNEGFLRPAGHIGVLYVDGILVDPETEILQLLADQQYTLTLQFTEGDEYATADFIVKFKGGQTVIVKGEVLEYSGKFLGFIGNPSPLRVSLWIEDEATGQPLTPRISKPTLTVESYEYEPIPVYTKDGKRLF